MEPRGIRCATRPYGRDSSVLNSRAEAIERRPLAVEIASMRLVASRTCILSSGGWAFAARPAQEPSKSQDDEWRSYDLELGSRFHRD